MALHSCLLTLCAAAAAVAATALNRTAPQPQRRQLRKTAGEHMDGVKA